MAKTKKPQTPGSVLQSFIDDYQINAFLLSKEIKTAYQSVTNIIKEKARITTPMALRLAQYFGNSPKFWIDVQSSSEINELSEDKKFVKIINSIPKAQKPAGKAKASAAKLAAKPGRNKTDTLAEKRKQAARVPGAKGAGRRRRG